MFAGLLEYLRLTISIEKQHRKLTRLQDAEQDMREVISEKTKKPHGGAMVLQGRVRHWTRKKRKRNVMYNDYCIGIKSDDCGLWMPGKSCSRRLCIWRKANKAHHDAELAVNAAKAEYDDLVQQRERLNCNFLGVGKKR